MDDLRANAPDQSEDDRTFARLCSEWGEQGRMAALMGVTNATIRRQLNLDDDNHASDYHRGRRLAYAAGYRQDATGEQLKAGLDEAYEAGVLDRLGSQSAARVEFPMELAHEVIEIEWNAAANSIPAARRLAKLRKLRRELKAYEERLSQASRSEAGSEREGREADSPRPRPVAANS